jgi:heme A synthase
MLAKATLVALFILLVWGNIVAGLKAGLACPDWPLCHGQVIPPFRWDIYVEFIHRILGAIASILIITLCYKRLRSYRGSYKAIPIVAVLLLVIQIFLGGIVVLLKLPVDLTTIHFANAIIIFSLVLYTVYFDGEKNIPRFSFSGPAGLFFLLSVLIFIQAVLGAYVRHSGSGLACPDFPRCLGFWIPPSLAGIVLNHYSHRLLAYFIFIIFIVIFILSNYKNSLKDANNYLLTACLLIVFQVMLGVLVVLTQLTFYVTALHLSIGLAILSITLLMWFKYINKDSFQY